MSAYLVVRAVVAETDRREFDNWYRTEHLPDAAKAFKAQTAPGVPGAARIHRCTTRTTSSPTPTRPRW